MLRFFKTKHHYLSPIVKNPRCLEPISRLHSLVERSDDESRIGISHPWTEWVELMNLLLKKGYLDEDLNPLENGKLGGSRDSNRIRTACLNFARDRFGIIRHLSRKDMRVIAGCGCPSLDRKVVNSGKRLRAHVGIGEGNVCGGCSLRGNCERAYVAAREDQGARTVDVMRILLTYGLDPVISTVRNSSCQNEVVKLSLRNLLKEMVEYSSKDTESELVNDTPYNEDISVSGEDSNTEVPTKQGDWHCPKCKFLNFARNIKCLRCDAFNEERLKQLRQDQEHLPLKKGDWICETCNFLNFAKNTRCLRCKAKPPIRQLNPGEWECESCNYINFRRNMVCLKCDHSRPKASKAPEASNQHENESAVNSSREGSKYSYRENDSGSRKPRGSDMRRFVEEENEERLNQDSRFLDFPVEGGKSPLSRCIEKREKWKMEMLERKSDAGTREAEEESWAAYNQRRMELLGSIDDDDGEMDDWFGERIQVKKHVPAWEKAEDPGT